MPPPALRRERIARDTQRKSNERHLNTTTCVPRRRFQAQGFGEDGAELAGDSETADGGGGGGTCSDEKPRGRHNGNGGEARSQEQQFKLFTNVVHEYIVDGAPNEINLR